MPGPHQYAPEWYEQMERAAERSARVVLPIVIEIVRPQTVVDIGCGTGGWLKVFTELGVSDVVGVDGPTVPTHLLKIQQQQFRAYDLDRDEVALGRMFDLAMALEVAEHLPEERAADLVRTLVSLSPAVMFGAAIPSQGGTFHVNEQWPDYWAGLFAGHGYVLLDVFRPRLWDNTQVEYWYAQNTFLFVRGDHLGALSPDLVAVAEGPAFPLRAVHPGLLGAYVAENRALAAHATPLRRRVATTLHRRLRPRSS